MRSRLQCTSSIRDQWLDLSVGRADLVEVPAEQLRQAREQRLTVIQSPPVTLLALAVSSSGALGNPDLRAAIALAVDRGALSNVIFQKQGEVTASLLPCRAHRLLVSFFHRAQPEQIACESTAGLRRRRSR